MGDSQINQMDCRGDFKRAEQVARKMLIEYGYSSFGQRYFDIDQISEKTKQILDEEIQSLLEECKNTACALIEQNKDKLEILYKELNEKRLLTSEEIIKLLDSSAKHRSQ